MAGVMRRLESDRVQRLIDWGVFGVGAGSLALALFMTLAGLMLPAEATAAAGTPGIVTAGSV